MRNAEWKARTRCVPDRRLVAGRNADWELVMKSTAAMILRRQTITEMEPGTVLRDFQTLLDLIGPEGITMATDGTRPTPLTAGRSAGAGRPA